MTSTKVLKSSPSSLHAGLPQPQYIYRFLSECNHFHFGLFAEEESAEAGPKELAPAMDRVVCRSVETTPPSGRIIDVGCGMGGATEMFARWGFDALGVDPNQDLIRFAMDRATNGIRPRYLPLSLEALNIEETKGAALDGRVDTVVCIEVLQHFLQLASFFEHLRDLLRDGGHVVIHDLTLRGAVTSDARPFHSRGAILRASERAGFEWVASEDLTAAARPTLRILLEQLRDRRTAILKAFLPTRAKVEEELDELKTHLLNLAAAIDEGFLSYEGLTLRARTTLAE